jgi:hypothetical protein
MARFTSATRPVGRPYVAAPVGVIPGINPGQWVRNQQTGKLERFAGVEADGTAVVIPRTGVVPAANMNALRLSVGRTRGNVLPRRTVS